MKFKCLRFQVSPKLKMLNLVTTYDRKTSLIKTMNFGFQLEEIYKGIGNS